MNKRFRTLLLAFALLVFGLPSAHSNAAALDPYYAQVAGLFHAYGEYIDWSLENKIEWLTAEQAYRGDTASPTAENEEAMDAYFLSTYGDGRWVGTVNLYYFLLAELGPAHTWTLEEMAGISELYSEYYPYQMDRQLWFVPEDSAISPDKAVDIAKQAIASAWSFPNDFDWTQWIVSMEYGIHKRDAEELDPYYTVYFGHLNDDPESLPYGIDHLCYVSNDGTVLDWSYSDRTPSPAEQLAEMTGE